MAILAPEKIVISRILDREDLEGATLGFEVKIGGVVARKAVAYVNSANPSSRMTSFSPYDFFDAPLPTLGAFSSADDAGKALYRDIMRDVEFLKHRYFPLHVVEDQVLAMSN